MDWLSQNWVWIVVGIIAVIWFMRRGGMAGCGMGHAHHGGGQSETDSGVPPSPRKDGDSVRTFIDPVSGKGVETQHAITSYYQGQAYYFENPETRQRFEASPEQYARNVPAQGGHGQRAHQHHGC